MVECGAVVPLASLENGVHFPTPRCSSVDYAIRLCCKEENEKGTCRDALVTLRSHCKSSSVDRYQDDETLELKHPDCVCDNCDILYIRPKEYQANAASRPRGPA